MIRTIEKRRPAALYPVESYLLNPSVLDDRFTELRNQKGPHRALANSACLALCLATGSPQRRPASLAV